MPAVLRCPTCPICRAWIAPRAVACPSCHAQRQSRHGMSLQGFQVYALLWLLCSALVLLLAVRMAAAPWLPDGEPPEYALWLLHASDTRPPPGCRISVRDLSGHEVAVSTADSCDGTPRVSAPAQRPRSPEQVALLRTLASALHSVLALALGAAVAGGLRNALRRAFRRPAGFAWVVRRSA